MIDILMNWWDRFMFTHRHGWRYAPPPDIACSRRRLGGDYW
jgi:hypothetical protein